MMNRVMDLRTNLLRRGPAILLLVLAMPLSALAEADGVPERRRSQFMNDPGYYVFPMPYSIPGVGEGLGVIGIGMNMGRSYTDLYGFALAGGLKGGGRTSWHPRQCRCSVSPTRRFRRCQSVPLIH